MVTAGNPNSEQVRRVILALLADATQIITDEGYQPAMNATIQAAIVSALSTATAAVVAA